MRRCRVPQIWRSLGPGQAEVPAEEAELYTYQRYRWLYPEKLASRYREFRLPALIEAALKVTNNGAAECVKVLKCLEGQYNKAFILSMSTGQDIVARIPNPNAGPKFYTIASEVATRHFLRDCLAIPVPRIHAWSTDESNPVGAEYILEEMAQGQSLGSIWGQLSIDSKHSIVKQVVGIEKKLASVALPRHAAFTAIPKQANVLGGFAIGPLTNPTLWQGQRATMNLNRGPWDNIPDYALAIADNEIRWAETYAEPKMNFRRSQAQPETPAEYISVIHRFMNIALHLVQDSLGKELGNRLCYSDLHLDNIFIDPKSKQITAIIDWQHTAASPVSLHPSYPQMFQPSETEDKERVKLEDHLYLDEPQSLDPLLEPVQLIPGCWDRGDFYSLRKSMITAVAHWHDIRQSDIECPVEFSKEEMEQLAGEMELLEEGLIPLGGMVPREDHENAQLWNNHCKEEFLKLAEDEEQRKMFAKLWPYS
ncbi:kinase-like domain-containing protein [Aspergillus karnatakaensis]|uniref:aminoglycoside phosphotransferase family protein n=1 Tax=Aspergillus karnatakaensis TaxID=1810916 RepID=UPI003CCD6D0E